MEERGYVSVAVQCDLTVVENEESVNTHFDHTYAIQCVDNPPTNLAFTDNKRINLETAAENDRDVEMIEEIGDSSGDELGDGNVDNQSESDYIPSSPESTESTMTMDCHLNSCAENKYIVFDSCLKKLLRFCPECGGIGIDITESVTGSMLTVSVSCSNGHTYKWNSQPIIRKMPFGNLLLAASILFSGNPFAAIERLAKMIDLQCISESTFYKIQDNHLFPVVNAAWERERENMVQTLKSRNKVNLDGDGRADSPGHNAKYGTYTLLDEDTCKVTDFSVVQVTEVSSSNAMEKEGFERCVARVENNDIKISRIATDRHSSIAKSMKTKHKGIRHQYDVWHVSKWVVKKLTKKAKVKSCKELSPWIQSISNHLWWSAATCGGDEELLREKWKSILHHVVNKHSWKDAKQFKKCAHKRLTNAQRKKTKWLTPGSPAHVALEEVVLNDRLLKDIGKLTDFCHTGELEVYHSMLLKYCPKRQHFSYRGMLARTQLAALDNNENTGRQQATVQNGENEGELRYKLAFPKSHKRWVVKPIKVAKSHGYLSEMVKDVIKSCEDGGTSTTQEHPNLPRNIASAPRPSKADLIAAHRSRFGRS